MTPLAPPIVTVSPPVRRAAEPDALRPAVAAEERAPRYTSYPPADRFRDDVGPDTHAHHLAARSARTSGWLSLYVHVPFCERLCWYCACNKTITRDRRKGARYLVALERELDLVLERLGGERVVGQIHLGGGSPTWLDDDELGILMALIRARFELHGRAEIAIEIDPRTVDESRIAALGALGFNRLSLGVQDLDERVQRAVNRVQPFARVESVLSAARRHGFASSNLDLVYGLPLQTPDSFARTVDSVIALRPERIALFHYAHLPSRFTAQRLIDETTLPTRAERLSIVDDARARLLGAGYVGIGLDHFALADDELAQASLAGRLHRNFQGYTTRPDRDLIGLGPSAISQIGSGMSQNAKGFTDWCERVESGRLATVRGLERGRDDLIRGSAIMALMCNGELDLEELGIAWLIEPALYFADELDRLEAFVRRGLVLRQRERIVVTERGHVEALRSIAAVFDRGLRDDHPARRRYSRVS